MSGQSQSLGRRLTAGTMLAGLISASLFGSVGAYAADTPNIDPSIQNGSITLHVRESGSLNNPADPSNAAAGGTTVANKTFTYYTIQNVDLKTKAGWDKVPTLPAATDAACAQAGNGTFAPGFTLSAGSQITTNGSGDSAKTTVPVGAYLVCDTTAGIGKKVSPFIATVPARGSAGWVYDVNIYPKQTVVTAATKTAADPSSLGIKTEDQMTFTIAAKVPQLAKQDDSPGATNEYFKHFIIADNLPTGFDKGKILSVQIADNEAGNAGLAPIPDNNYIKKDSTTNPNKAHWLTVSFNQNGLTYLKGKANKYVIVTVKARAVGVDPAKTTNTGYLFVDTEKNTTGQPTPNTDDTNPPYTPPTTGDDTPKVPGEGGGNVPAPGTNKVAMLWGGAKIKKHGATTAKAGLKGAVFEVYEAENATADTCSKERKQPETPISVGDQTRFTSKDDGSVDIDGLYVGKVQAAAGAEPAINGKHKCYVLKEVTAPTGYALPQGEAAYVPVKVVPGEPQTAMLEFQNDPVSIPELPVTGASGTVLMTLGGIALMFVGTGVVLVRRRQRAHAR